MGKYIIDANVVLLAGTPVKDIPSDQLLCAQKCIKFINNFVTKADNILVLDAEGRIMKEYRGLYSPDRKYIALAFQHKEHPPIVEASDSKWWGIREEMERCGLNIRFIDETYIKEKYAQKMGH